MALHGRRAVSAGVLGAVLALVLGPVLAGCSGEPASWTLDERGDAATPLRTATVTHGEDRRVDKGRSPRSEPRQLRGSGRWRSTRPAMQGEVEGYTTTVSGPPGTRVGVKVSTTAPRFELLAFRIGDYRGGDGRVVWRSGLRPGTRQHGPTFADVGTRTVVARWHRSLTLDTTGWEPGFYVLKLRSSDGWENQIPYVVSSPSAAGTVAMVAPVTTWQAYNLWGGYSLYHGPDNDRRSWAVSFDRPYLGVGGYNNFRSMVVPILVRADASGVPLSWFTNVDLHRRPDLLNGARGYVSMGHDEYWTQAMRATVLRARDRGTNLAFLGANTMYWRIRLDATPTGPDRLVTGYRSDAWADPLREERPREATARFRDPPAPTPENHLTGMLYECYPVDADYVVASPRWWGFAGTGARRGTVVTGLVGGEADRVYPNRSMPRPLQVLSHNAYSCRGVTTTAQSTYYTTRSGAGVFSAGTLRWGCALVDLCPDRRLGVATSRFVRHVTTNLLHGFAQGPVGRAHPARDNVGSFDLPLVNSVDAS